MVRTVAHSPRERSGWNSGDRSIEDLYGLALDSSTGRETHRKLIGVAMLATVLTVAAALVDEV